MVVDTREELRTGPLNLRVPNCARQPALIDTQLEQLHSPIFEAPFECRLASPLQDNCSINRELSFICDFRERSNAS